VLQSPDTAIQIKGFQVAFRLIETERALSKVLIVEDDDLYFEALQRHFKRRGSHVFHAMSLKAATNALADNSFDMVVIDPGMPDFGCNKEDASARMLVLDTIIGNSPRAVHVVITGRFTSAEADESRKRGARGYLAKSRLNAPMLASLFDQIAHSEFVVHSGNIVAGKVSEDNPNLSLSEEECLRWVEQRPAGMKRNELFDLMARHFGFKNPTIAEQKYKRARQKVIAARRESLVGSAKGRVGGGPA
jgi:ActR/RegA family two-component response regulator